MSNDITIFRQLMVRWRPGISPGYTCAFYSLMGESWLTEAPEEVLIDFCRMRKLLDPIRQKVSDQVRENRFPGLEMNTEQDLDRLLDQDRELDRAPTEEEREEAKTDVVLVELSTLLEDELQDPENVISGLVQLASTGEKQKSLCVEAASAMRYCLRFLISEKALKNDASCSEALQSRFAVIDRLVDSVGRHPGWEFCGIKTR